MHKNCSADVFYAPKSVMLLISEKYPIRISGGFLLLSWICSSSACLFYQFNRCPSPRLKFCRPADLPAAAFRAISCISHLYASFVQDIPDAIRGSAWPENTADWIQHFYHCDCYHSQINKSCDIWSSCGGDIGDWCSVVFIFSIILKTDAVGSSETSVNMCEYRVNMRHTQLSGRLS
jgi:hypothetical protein